MRLCYIKTRGSDWKELYESVRHSVQWSRKRTGKLLFTWLSSQLGGDEPVHSHGREGRLSDPIWETGR